MFCCASHPPPKQDPRPRHAECTSAASGSRQVDEKPGLHKRASTAWKNVAKSIQGPEPTEAGPFFFSFFSLERASANGEEGACCARRDFFFSFCGSRLLALAWRSTCNGSRRIYSDVGPRRTLTTGGIEAEEDGPARSMENRGKNVARASTERPGPWMSCNGPPPAGTEFDPGWRRPSTRPQETSGLYWHEGPSPAPAAEARTERGSLPTIRLGRRQ